MEINMTDIKKILKETKTIAIVGLSPKPGRSSNMVAKYLIDKGYKIIPVNPKYAEILREKSYKHLKEIPPDIKIDMVNVFRKSENS